MLSLSQVCIDQSGVIRVDAVVGNHRVVNIPRLCTNTLNDKFFVLVIVDLVIDEL